MVLGGRQQIWSSWALFSYGALAAAESNPWVHPVQALGTELLLHHEAGKAMHSASNQM